MNDRAGAPAELSVHRRLYFCVDVVFMSTTRGYS